MTLEVRAGLVGLSAAYLSVVKNGKRDTRYSQPVPSVIPPTARGLFRDGTNPARYSGVLKLRTARFPGELNYHATIPRNASRRMYHSTGFTQDEISELCVMVWQAADEAGKAAWPPGLGLYKSVLVTLFCLRRNRVQAEIAESFRVSQPAISRAISAISTLLKKALAVTTPAAGEPDPRTQLIVDGTLLPCWSWASAPGLYSGKHKTTGMNVQVACTLEGEIAWISDPVEGTPPTRSAPAAHHRSDPAAPALDSPDPTS